MTALAGIALAALSVIIAGVLIYWQLIVAEGAYLGRHVVTLLYDVFAPRYDAVKQFQVDSDTLMLAVPIMAHLSQLPVSERKDVCLLDIATGTGRLPYVLLMQNAYKGSITALDLSEAMLSCAKAKLNAYAKRITWLKHDAQELPFDSNVFHVVTCLEALEFIPRQRQAVTEMFRVLKPSGLLLVSNRVGPDVWKLPGRTQPTKRLIDILKSIGCKQVRTEKWLVDYDLVWAVK